MVRTAVHAAKFVARKRPVLAENAFRTAVQETIQICVSSVGRMSAEMSIARMPTIVVPATMPVQIIQRQMRHRAYARTVFANIHAIVVIQIVVA